MIRRRLRIRNYAGRARHVTCARVRRRGASRCSRGSRTRIPVDAELLARPNRLQLLLLPCPVRVPPITQRFQLANLQLLMLFLCIRNNWVCVSLNPIWPVFFAVILFVLGFLMRIESLQFVSTKSKSQLRRRRLSEEQTPLLHR